MDANRTYPYISSVGDSAALIEFAGVLDKNANAAVLEFDNVLTEKPIQGVAEVSPALVSLLVRFDPLQANYAEIKQCLLQRLGSKDWLTNPEVIAPVRWKVPVLYGHTAGSDLAEVADMLGVTSATAIEEHSSSVLRVLTLGFAPGCSYLGMLPPQWDLPRLKVIKPEVPAGAILVAVRQTVMPSAPMPTGWRCIGCTPFNNFDPTQTPPVLIKHGDEVQYFPVSESEFNKLKTAQTNGKAVLEQVL